MVLPNLIEKLKERKQNVIEGIRSCLDAVGKVLSLQQMIEEVAPTYQHKNPQVKAESLLWLNRYLKDLKKLPNLGKNELKVLNDVVKKGVDDGSNDVREASMELIAIMGKHMGDRYFNQFDNLDEKKMAKIREYLVKVGGKVANAPAAPTPAPVSKPSLSKQSSAKSLIKDKENSPPSLPSKSNNSSSQSMTMKKSASSLKKKPSQIISAPIANEPPQSATVKYSLESALQIVQADISEEKLKSLDDANWKIRLEAIENVYTVMQSLASSSDTDAYAVFLASKLKDSNFQVVSKTLSCLQHIVENWSFKASAAVAVVGLISEKLTDLKLKKVSGDIMSSIAEKVSLNFVFEQCYDVMLKQKSPKIVMDFIKWANGAVTEFGIKKLSVKNVVEFLKPNLESSNAALRASAVQMVCTLRQYANDVQFLLTGANPAILTTIENEFKKIEGQTPPAPTRFYQASSQEGVFSANANISSYEAAAVEEEEEDIIPRTDITPQLSPALFQLLGDGNWKNRKEGLDQLQAIINSTNKKIKMGSGNAIHDLMVEMKARLGDSNKNLVMLSLDIVGSLAESIGKDFDKQAKYISQYVITCLTDNKIQVRTAAVKTLNSMIVACKNIDPITSSSNTCLMAENPNMRKELLKLFTDVFDAENETYKKVSKPTSSIQELVPCLVQCLMDKQPDVRKNSLSVLQVVIDKCGYDVIKERVNNDLKGTNLTTVLSQLEGLKKDKVVIKRETAAPERPVSTASINPLKKQGSSASIKSQTAKPALKKSSSLPVEDEAPLKPNYLANQSYKEQRAEKDKGSHKWNYDPERRDLLDLLKEQLESTFTVSFTAKLFSEDFKEQLGAIGQLEVIITDANTSVLLSITDLIFKYFSVRLYDSNTTMIFKVLEVLENMVQILDQNDYRLNDYEANIVFPNVVVRLGDAKEAVRGKVRSLIRLLSHVYPSSKIVNYINEFGLKSKNAKARMEGIEELTFIIERNGLSVCNSKLVLSIGLFIADRDTTVRNAALKFCVQAISMDESIYGNLQKTLQPAQLSLLDERRKRTAGAVKEFAPSNKSPSKLERPLSSGRNSMTGRPSSVTGNEPEVSSNTSVTSKPFSLDLENLNLPKVSDSYNQNFADYVKPVMAPAAFVNPTPMIHEKQYDIRIQAIKGTDVGNCIETLKQISSQFMTVIEYPGLDSLIDTIISKVHSSFTLIDLANDEQVRLCKHLINSLVQLFTNKQLAVGLSKGTLETLFHELIERLLDEQLNTEAGNQLSRALNVLMVRVLENGEKNYCFSVLIKLLGKTSSLLSSDYSPNSYQTKYTDLIMKCLWKMTKSVKDYFPKMNIPELLLDIHEFLVHLPPSEWKRRVQNKVSLTDLPLRTAKTILHELVLYYNETVLSFLIKIDQPDKSYVYSYLNLMLEKRKSGRKDAVLEDDAEEEKKETEEKPQEKAKEVLDEIEFGERLKRVFRMIGSTNETKQVAYE
jgi:cytoskeleton-associated protein 5